MYIAELENSFFDVTNKLKENFEKKFVDSGIVKICDEPDLEQSRPGLIGLPPSPQSHPGRAQDNLGFWRPNTERRRVNLIIGRLDHHIWKIKAKNCKVFDNMCP